MTKESEVGGQHGEREKKETRCAWSIIKEIWDGKRGGVVSQSRVGGNQCKCRRSPKFQKDVLTLHLKPDEVSVTVVMLQRLWR